MQMPRRTTNAAEDSWRETEGQPSPLHEIDVTTEQPSNEEEEEEEEEDPLMFDKKKMSPTVQEWVSVQHACIAI